MPIYSDITDFLDNLDLPVHEGYALYDFDITAGTITNVTGDATVYIRYSVEGTIHELSGYLNDDGDIAIETENSGWTYTGSADIVITMSKNFDTVDYDTHDIYDKSIVTGEKLLIRPSVVEGNTISFTDGSIGLPFWYSIELVKDGERIGETALDSGFKPVSLSVTQNGKTDTYDVVTDW